MAEKCLFFAVEMKN